MPDPGFPSDLESLKMRSRAAFPDRTPMNRREVMAQLGAAGLGFAVGGKSAFAALGPIRRTGEPALKIALNAYSFAKLLNDHNKGRGKGTTLFDLVNFCATQGLEGLDATGYFFAGYPAVPPHALVHELKRHAFESGIGISGTGVRNNFTTADRAARAADVRHIKDWVEVAARLGAPVLRVFADTQIKAQTWQTVSQGAAREQVEEWIAENLKACAEHGKNHGVVIGVQNHGDFIRTAEDHLGLIKRVDSEWCGAIVDTGYYKSVDPYADMAKAAPFAVNWQIKESPFGAGHATPTDLKRLMTLVRQSGYRGYLPIETLSTPGQDYDPYVVVPRFLAEIRRAVKDTASVAGPVPAPEEPTSPSVPPAPERPARKPANKYQNK